MSVEYDHAAETIYFKMGRFYDNMDLSTLTCIIQYINANGDARIYAVPFFDIETYAETQEMLIPWCIEGDATAFDGPVEYAIRFYKVDAEIDGDGTIKSVKYIYNMNTLISKSKVLHGMPPMEASEPYKEDPESQVAKELLLLLQRVDRLENTWDIYWLEMFN